VFLLLHPAPISDITRGGAARNTGNTGNETMANVRNNYRRITKADVQHANANDNGYGYGYGWVVRVHGVELAAEDLRWASGLVWLYVNGKWSCEVRQQVYVRIGTPAEFELAPADANV